MFRVCIEASSCLHVWLNGWLRGCPPSPAPLSVLGWYQVDQSPKPLITWLVFLAWPTPILSHLISINYQVQVCGPRGQLWIRKHPITRKFQGLSAYLSGTRGKDQQNSLLHGGRDDMSSVLSWIHTGAVKICRVNNRTCTASQSKASVFILRKGRVGQSLFWERFTSGICNSHITHSSSSTFSYFHWVPPTITISYYCETDFELLLKTLLLPSAPVQWDFTMRRAKEVRRRTLHKEIQLLSG